MAKVPSNSHLEQPADTTTEILKKPMQTSITIDNLDFDEFNVEDQLHVGIMLKDFKSIAVHAESLKASVSACYSVPNQPMQITYTEFGIACEFTLATFGDHRESAVTPARTSVGRPSMVGPKGQSIKRNSAREPSQNHRTVLPDAPERSMPPPALSRNKDPQSRLSPKGTSGRASPPPPKPSVDPESLFYSQHDEEDQRWNEKSWDQDEDQVGWSANARVSLSCVTCAAYVHNILLAWQAGCWEQTFSGNEPGQ